VAVAAIGIALLVERRRIAVTVAAGALLAFGAISMAAALAAAGPFSPVNEERVRTPEGVTSARELVSVAQLATFRPRSMPEAGGAPLRVALGTPGVRYWPRAGAIVLFLGGALLFTSGLAARTVRRRDRRVRAAGVAGVVLAVTGVAVTRVEFYVGHGLADLSFLLLAAGVVLATLATVLAVAGRPHVSQHPLPLLPIIGATLIVLALLGSHTFFDVDHVRGTSWAALELATVAGVGMTSAVLARWEADRVLAAAMLVAAGIQASLFLAHYVLSQGGGGAVVALLGSLALVRAGWQMLAASEGYDLRALLHLQAH
jgi:hypothetical protein